MKTQFIYGTHPVAALLEHQPQQIRRIFIGQAAAAAPRQGKKKHQSRAPREATSGPSGDSTAELPQRITRVVAEAKRNEIAVENVTQQWFSDRFDGVPHQRIAAEYLPLPSRGLKELAVHLDNLQGRALLLVLDGIQDPQNVGACLRVAAGMDASAVILPANRSIGLTPTVHKAAAGAAAVMPVFHVSNLGQALKLLKDKGCWIYGSAGDAPAVLPEMDFSESSVLVMGSEGDGLRERTKGLCDQLFRIPMPGPVESFNVSVAAGIALYAIRTQWDTVG